MKKLTILVDADDTIEGLLKAWLGVLNWKYHTNVKYEDAVAWDIETLFPNLTEEQIYRPLLRNEFWGLVDPIEGAVENLQKIYDDGHDIYIVTASHYQSLQGKMERLIFRHFPFIDWEHVIITSHKQLIHGDILQNRERKGRYLDVYIEGDGEGQSICAELESLFEGRSKKTRHIPNEVFTWNKSSQLSFLAGMIDADGYINDNLRVPYVQIGSTNKELAIQQALLAQRLGMRASIYQNHYKGKGRGDTIRYHVAFHPTKELVDCVACQKKKDMFNENTPRNFSISKTDVSTLRSREILNEKAPSYDVTTESEHFTVSGIYSHNCRSFLTPDRFTEAGIGNIANAGNYEPGKHKYYGRLTIRLGRPLNLVNAR